MLDLGSQLEFANSRLNLAQSASGDIADEPSRFTHDCQLPSVLDRPELLDRIATVHPAHSTSCSVLERGHLGNSHLHRRIGYARTPPQLPQWLSNGANEAMLGD